MKKKTIDAYTHTHHTYAYIPNKIGDTVAENRQVTHLLFQAFYVVRSFRFETDMVALVVVVVVSGGGEGGDGGSEWWCYLLCWANVIVYTVLQYSTLIIEWFWKIMWTEYAYIFYGKVCVTHRIASLFKTYHSQHCLQVNAVFMCMFEFFFFGEIISLLSLKPYSFFFYQNFGHARSNEVPLSLQS